MVSTQHTLLPTTGIPQILGRIAHANPASVKGVLASITVTTSSQPCKSVDFRALADHLHKSSAAVLNGISYDGQQPESIAHLIEMGNTRNAAAKTHDGIDEIAAFHNDVAYYKVLLKAREKHRAAMRAKIHALRNLRAKQRKMYLKRTPAKQSTAIVAAALARAVSNPNHASEKNRLGEDKKAIPECSSPVSTDFESEVSSDFGDTDVSDQKPVMFRA